MVFLNVATAFIAAAALPPTVHALPQLLSNVVAPVVSSVATTVLGPNLRDPRFTNFVAPGPGDVRSPCPGLNALANHGFIHHDGKNMTVPHLIEGLSAGLNVAADFTTAIGTAGLLAAPISQTRDPLTAYFNLDQLNQHNFPTEHDGSLSRADAFFGDNHSFNPSIFNQVLAFFAGSATTSISTASKARYARIKDSLARNPQVVYGPREFVLSYGETALYLQTMGDVTSGVTRVDYIRSLFEKEKLPWDLGWRPSTVSISLVTLAAMIATGLYPASGEPLPEGFQAFGPGVLQAAFAARDPITNILGNVTQLATGQA